MSFDFKVSDGTDESAVATMTVNVGDEAPPELASATVGSTGRRLLLVFNEDLDNGVGKRPPASAFTVTADGVRG